MYYKKNFYKAALTVLVKQKESNSFDVLIKPWYAEVEKLLASRFLPALPFKYETKFENGKAVFSFENLIREELIILVFLVEAFEMTGDIGLVVEPQSILMGLNYRFYSEAIE